MASIYRSYHSTLKIQYAEGRLPSDISVPRSTRQRWKDKNAKSFWTPYPLADGCDDNYGLLLLVKRENEKLKIQVKLLLQFILFYKKLITLLPLKEVQLLKLKKEINWLLQCNAMHTSEEIIWRYLPCSPKQWKIWTGYKHCANSLQGRCRKQKPQQLSLEEQEMIRTACSGKEFEHWPLNSIYYQLLREKRISCCLSTFYKYCRLLHITRSRIKKNKNYNPLRTTEPLKVLHQDITLFRTANGIKHYVYVIRDNFSRAILACKVATTYNSEVARQTLEGVLLRFNLINRHGTLITDGGVENKGVLEEWLSKPGMLWQKLVAQLDIIQSNSMVEAANKILKYRYLYTQPVPDTTSLIATLADAVERYNNMPNGQLHGLSPNEVLTGAQPDRNRFKVQLAAGKKQRVIRNRNFTCNSSCQTE